MNIRLKIKTLLLGLVGLLVAVAALQGAFAISRIAMVNADTRRWGRTGYRP